MNRRFGAALAVYAVLALLAWLTLNGTFLWATWIFLGGIAVKTCLVVLQRRMD